MSPSGLLLRGGEVIDRQSGLRGPRDVAFDGDRVTAIEDKLDRSSAQQIVDVSGCLVVPGLVDVHSHVFDGVGDGVDADEYCLRRGTTTTVDGGSAGANTIVAFRRLAANKRARVLAWLNLSTIGQVDLRVGELMALPWADVDAAVAAAKANPDLIVGFKARLSTYVAGGACQTVLRLVLEAGEAAGLPIMIHVGDTQDPLSEILPRLRPGDVMTHTLTGRKFGILRGDGKIIPEAFEARERGVLFDAARGRNHVAFPVMQAAVDQGFIPDSLATDITVGTAADPEFGMPLMATHLLSFGVPLEDVLPRVTINPAKAARRDDLGRLQVGGIGDATVLRLVEGDFTLQDVDGRVRKTDRRLTAVGVVRAGEYQAIP
jgi:dihydroorotase